MRILILAVVAACAAPPAPPPQPAAAEMASESAPAYAARVEQMASEYLAKSHVPGMTVALVIDGRLAWSHAFGLADVENHVAMTADTKLRTASIAKPMTAIAAMQLVEQHKLELDADLRTYCPAFPAKPWPITVRELLDHQSGIRHYGGPRDREEWYSAIHYANVTASLAPFKDDALLFEPGTKFGYSTYAYVVLGCVLEGAAGQPFVQLMRRAVWDPAGMRDTRDDDPFALIDHRAAGYRWLDGALGNAPLVDMTNRTSGGGLRTTAIDLAHLAEAMLANRLVSAATFAQMTTPSALRSGERVPYGLGWAVALEPWHDDVWVNHSGATPGFSGYLAILPRHRFAVALLTNLEDAPEREELAEAIAKTVLGL